MANDECNRCRATVPHGWTTLGLCQKCLAEMVNLEKRVKDVEARLARVERSIRISQWRA